MAGTLTFIKTFTTNGAMTFTGNTLGLSKEFGSQDAGKAGSIGAMITADNSQNVSTYPTDANAGTTLNYTLNNSYAYLNIPSGSTILWAELYWAGSYKTENQNYSSVINDPNYAVNFVTPSGSNSVKNDVIEKYNNEGILYYLAYANVTTIVQSLPTGLNKIICGKVVGTTDPEDDNSNACGWTLGVIYQNPTMPSRNMTLYAGNNSTFVEQGNTVTTTATGFETPNSGVVQGRILITTLEGDDIIPGDKAGLTNSSNVLHYLYGPKNLVDNFFASQINNDSGQTNFLGSFGSRNQNPDGTNILAGRQGWDITNVDANPAPNVNLDNSQTSTTLQFSSKGDRYWVTGVGIQLDVNAPIIKAVKEVTKPTVVVGETFDYILTVTNNGTSVANGVIVTDSLPAGLTYISATVTPAGATITPPPAVPAPPASQLVTIALNNPLGVGDSVIIDYKVKVFSIPDSRAFVNQSTIKYTYSIPGNPANPGTATSNQVSTSILAPLPPIVTNYTVDSCKNANVTGVVQGIDVDGHYPLLYGIFTPPTNGFASINSTTGNWIYTPKVGFVGTDTFVVSISDTEMATSFSTITINVLDKLCCEINNNENCNNKNCCD